MFDLVLRWILVGLGACVAFCLVLYFVVQRPRYQRARRERQTEYSGREDRLASWESALDEKPDRTSRKR